MPPAARPPSARPSTRSSRRISDQVEKSGPSSGQASGRRSAIGRWTLVAALVGAGILAAAATAASLNFFQPASSPEATGGIGPESVVSADLDGDGDQDLAVANGSSDNVGILKNNGTGNFFLSPSGPEPAGDEPRHLAAADLDGDGDQDLAVANNGGSSHEVTILKNNGTGNFFQPPSSPETAGDRPSSVAAADLDGDGDQDLAVANIATPGDVTILKNKGTGDFFEPPSSPEDGRTGVNPEFVAAIDLDGDGDRDLAVANFGSDDVTILKNNGSGNFFEPPSSPETAPGDARWIAVADLDGDGDRDLAVANGFGDTVTILKNMVNSGNFYEPRSMSPIPVGDFPLSLDAADFDGDGDPDVAVGNHDPDNITVLENPGNGALTEAASSPETVGPAPRQVISADLDGDGDPDLATANQGLGGSVTVLKNR